MSLLIGSGLTTAVAKLASIPAVDMTTSRFECDLADEVDRAAGEEARRCGRGAPNLEEASLGLSERQKKAIDFVRANGRIGNAEYQRLGGGHQKDGFPGPG